MRFYCMGSQRDVGNFRATNGEEGGMGIHTGFPFARITGEGKRGRAKRWNMGDSWGGRCTVGSGDAVGRGPT